MKYGVLQKGMWIVFKRSFKKALVTELEETNPKLVMNKANRDYKNIISEINEFDKDDRFIIIILSCSMLASILMNLEKIYDVEDIRKYYKSGMDNFIMRFFMKHDKTYTAKGQAKMKRSADRSQEIINPYSWKFSYEPGKTVNQYTAIFTTCGICYLMKELGLEKYVPSMCAFDYEMNAMNSTEFTRQFTLAEGGHCCDCHYNHRQS